MPLTTKTLNRELFTIPAELQRQIDAWRANLGEDIFDEGEEPHQSHPLIPLQFVYDHGQWVVEGVDTIDPEDVLFTYDGIARHRFGAPRIKVTLDDGSLWIISMHRGWIYGKILTADNLNALYETTKNPDAAQVGRDILNDIQGLLIEPNTDFHKECRVVATDGTCELIYQHRTEIPERAVVSEDIGGTVLVFEQARDRISDRNIHGIRWRIGFAPNSISGHWLSSYQRWTATAHQAWGMNYQPAGRRPVFATDDHVGRPTRRLLTVEQMRQQSRENTRPSTNRDGQLEGHNVKVPDVIAETFRHTQGETDVVYLGLEIEGCVKRGHHLRDFIRQFGNSDMAQYGLLKFDRSAGEHDGFELTTIPASLSWHKQELRKFFDQHTANIMTDDRHGIHVHIGRNHLSQLEQLKILQFMNDTVNRDFVRNIAGRATNVYCRFVEGVKYSREVRSQGNPNGRQDRDTARRKTVNLTNPSTIELRVFQGSVKKNTVFRKLEFCDSLVRFAKTHGIAQMTEKKYVDFMLLQENQTKYPYMLRWLASKNYIGYERKFIPKLGKVVHVFGENKLRKVSK